MSLSQQHQTTESSENWWLNSPNWHTTHKIVQVFEIQHVTFAYFLFLLFYFFILQQILHLVLSEMWKKATLTEFIIKVDDRSIDHHKCALCASCHYFKALFESDTERSTQIHEKRKFHHQRQTKTPLKESSVQILRGRKLFFQTFFMFSVASINLLHPLKITFLVILCSPIQFLFSNTCLKVEFH